MDKTSNQVKIGVIGVGYLGNYHVQQLQQIENSIVVGIYDSDKNRLSKISNDYSVKAFSDIDDLLRKCDAVSIATPTSTHHLVAQKALSAGCHLFIEKPITQTVEEAQNLLEMSSKNKKIIQVGHIEQFNPAFLALDKQHISPMFIESHRLAPFNPRGIDVPVVLDLMIHDIEIVLSLVKSKVTEIRASGVKVASTSEDIANARIEFQNGCIANLTASRISQKKMRKMRLFQENTYVTVDFLEGIVEMYETHDKNITAPKNTQVFPFDGHEEKVVWYVKPEVKPANALRLELEHFIESISLEKIPDVDGKNATDALHLAIEIQNIIEK
ncbi:MAG: Gfo/Idh/MocA family oxidoreductase [Candidatus Marinimicrobia bacterium]|nr:Gfo/Idh/MocA family oxidoreductase [Candidatus Neomarinimicrobiota bacterium]MBL7108716.1 Gfo/Idh/MocA family oxidoreductase [Candidatus Neomarinimicrobiota bacterium]